MGAGLSAQRFLDTLADPERTVAGAEHIAIVVAHPDDETLGCGGQLARLRGASLTVVTDGAPRNLADARSYGFDSAEEYAAARRQELETALAIAGWPADAAIGLGFPDQQAAFNLVTVTRALTRHFAVRATELVLTHAYEGGHPDHDAVAFCVHRAVRAAARQGRRIDVVEMPLYRLGPGGMLRQSFSSETHPPAIALVLSEAQQRAKQFMVEAHNSQRQTLAPFALDVERFRAAPDYDFSLAPNGGAVLYERFNWGLDAARWRTLVAAADAELAA